MRFFYPDTPDIPLPDNHRFPRGKYRQLKARLEAEGLLPADSLLASPPATAEQLSRAHTPTYIEAIASGTLDADQQRRIGLPWSDILAQRARIVVGGAVAAALAALQTGLSGQLAGGTHHAHRDFGSGFCVFNDLSVAALELIALHGVRRLAIIDLDVHQGDGNAAILQDRDDVFVLSVHGENNFPFRKMRSTLDVALPDGTGDDAYLAALLPALQQVEAFRPEFIFYLSGADPLATDKLGRLALTFTGLASRDRMVFELARRLHSPVSIATGGGYSNPIDDTLTAHANTFRIARETMRL